MNLGSASLQASSCNKWRNQQSFQFTWNKRRVPVSFFLKRAGQLCINYIKKIEKSNIDQNPEFLFLNILSQELVTSELLKSTLQPVHYMGDITAREIAASFQTHKRQELQHWKDATQLPPEKSDIWTSRWSPKHNFN